MRSAVNRKKLEDPAFKARQLRTLRAANHRAWSDPASREKMAAAGRKNIRATMTPKARAKWLAGRAKASRKRSETMLADIPEDRREEYKILRRRLRSRDKAKAVILASLTPFERQMHALRNGARLIEKPILRRPDHAFTLGGVSDMTA